MVKVINKARSKMDLEAEAVAPKIPEDVLLLREIRDSLKK
jgi:large-conductance mechanosensitive channel